MPESSFRPGRLLFHLLLLNGLVQDLFLKLPVVAGHPVFAREQSHRKEHKQKIKSKKSVFHAITSLALSWASLLSS